MPFEYQKHQLMYFRPGQIACLAAHQDQEPHEDQLRAMVNSINEYLQGGHIIWPPRILSFPAAPAEDNESSEGPATRPTSPFSIIFCDMENVGDNPSYLLELITTLDTELRDRDFAGLILQVVSPNWLASGAPGNSGSGGPGSWPVPYCGTPNRAPYDFPGLRALLDENHLQGDGSGVDIAILDTAPCLHDLVQAYEEWHDRHPLISTLLAPGGPLQVYPATLEQLHRMGDVVLDGHEYKMTDHGLFVAGIIHTLAPKANIHLIEVLNPYGVGDIETIAKGFQRVIEMIQQNLQQTPPRALVVNCSLVLNLPVVFEHGCAEHTLQPNRELLDDILNRARDPSWSLRQAQDVEILCKSIYALRSKVVAAAGNDRRGEVSPQPQARYPAAFDDVEGIGALSKNISGTSPGQLKAASYSNLADQPPPAGIATLGGEGGEGQGLLGLYLGEFPCCQPNCTKWAWWAGTSFATPILTGTIASVLSSPSRPRTVQAAIAALRTANIIRTNAEPTGESDLPVTQG